MKNTNQTFEEKLVRLEQIVRELEKGEVPLENSLKLFQEGTQLAAECGKILDDAELQVKKIIPGANGEPEEEAFTDEE